MGRARLHPRQGLSDLLRTADAALRAPAKPGLAAIALVALSCASPRAFRASDDAAIRAVLTAQVDAWNRGDLEAYMDGYARGPGLVFTSGGNIRRGWDETFAKYEARYGTAPETMGRLGFEILEVQPVGADGAVVLGRWRLDDTLEAGGGVFSVVLERRPEGWRVVHDHTSSDPPD